MVSVYSLCYLKSGFMKTYQERSALAVVSSSNTAVAGFASAADEHMEDRIDLNKLLVHKKEATFFLRMSGNSMIGAGMFAGDMLVVDRSLKASFGRIVVACIDGEFVVKRFIKRRGKVFLYSENDKYKPLEVSKLEEFSVWGVVTNVIHKV
jgi:DNA polymerase V